MSLEQLAMIAKGLEGQIDANSGITKETDDTHHSATQHKNGITTHYKVTQTTEGEMSVVKDNEDTQDNNDQKKSRKRCKLFSSCFGRLK